jgi:selenide,water dikinase
LEAVIVGSADAATKALLFDPQTAGGLLAGVRAGRAAGCIAELRRAGFTAAVRIGSVRALHEAGESRVALTAALG